LDYPKKKMEIIVIDNGSTDGTSGMVSKYKDVKLLRMKNPGKADALNLGLKHATGEVIGFLDADTSVSKDCLKKMVGYFDDHKVGVITTLIKTDVNKGFLSKMQYIEYIFSALSKKLISLLNSMYVTQGTLALTRKDLLQEIGFSSDTLTEDMDLALSIRKKGFKIVNCMDAVTYTRIPRNIKELFKQRVRWYRGFIENTKKHSDIFFNKNIPHLGWFILPMSFLAIFVGIILFFSLAFDVIFNFFIATESAPYLAINDQIKVLLNHMDIKNHLFLGPHYTIFFVLIFFTSFFILTYALKIMLSISFINLIQLPIYMIIYYFFIMIIWIYAFFLEVLGRKKRW